MKIRVWEQEQWDGIIMIDVDVTVLGDLTHLFHLPTDFAAVPDNGKVWNRWDLIAKLHSLLPAGCMFSRHIGTVASLHLSTSVCCSCCVRHCSLSFVFRQSLINMFWVDHWTFCLRMSCAAFMPSL